MVCHFVSDSHEVMTALIVVLPLIVVMEISLQLHRSLKNYLTCAPLCHQTSTAFSTGEGKAGSKQRGDGHVCISPQQYGNCSFQGGRPAPEVLGWA